MKKTYLIASFVAISAGAIGAGAAVQSINGSDTLFTISTDVVNNTGSLFAGPLTAISYIGGGSGTGENALLAGTQQIAPMSRFLKSVCTSNGASASPPTSQGLVIGLDGVSLIMNGPTGTGGGPGTGASADCNGADQTDDSKVTTLGFVSNKSISWSAGTYTTYGGAVGNYAANSYSFTDWTDVIRILFAGMDHTDGNDGRLQNCKSDVRAALINNWGLVFQNQGCVSGNCQKINHGYRRDDYSGTTDTVTNILNLFSIPSDTHLADPFCNYYNTHSDYTGSKANQNGPGLTFPPANLPGYMQFTGTTTTSMGQPLATFQDMDPIRTPCVASDKVCEQDGTLGWELVIEPTSDISVTQGYATTGGVRKACTTKMGFGVAPLLTNGTAYCPNGDSTIFAGVECLEPVAQDGDFACEATSDATPSFKYNGPNWTSSFDARVYNLIVHVGGTGSGSGGVPLAANGLPFQAGFFRKFEDKCQLRDATQQIGCFIGIADACSIGYAGLGATAQVGADAMRLDGILPTIDNVQTFGYPFSRKLYLSTLKGFASVADTTPAGIGELQFAKNESAPALQNIVFNEGFVKLPSTLGVAGGASAAYCEDYNEAMMCGSGGKYLGNDNVNMCDSTHSPSWVSTMNTTCGNGTLEAYERCDSGATTNGVSPSNCTKTCTCAKGSIDANGHCCINHLGVDCCASGASCTPGDSSI